MSAAGRMAQLEADNARLAQTVEELREERDNLRAALSEYDGLLNDQLAVSEPEPKTVTDQLGNRFHRLTASEPEAEQGE